MNEIKLDTLLINGKIYTLRAEGETVESIGIDKGTIVYAGPNPEPGRYHASEIIDLGNKTVIPGMGDSHLHLYAYCQNQALVKLQDIRSLEELITVMKEKTDKTQKGKWVKGAGFDHTKFDENRLPDRWDLDRISTEHPIVIRRCCLHVMVANSMAIKIANINKELIKEAGGLIELDENGEMTGIFREKATSIFDDIVPDPLADEKEKNRIMREVFEDMVSKGITSINTYAAKIWNYEEDIETYRSLDRKGSLPLRVLVSIDDFFENDNPAEKNPYSKVKYGSYKLFTDGSLGARSAALLEPYSDDEDNIGILADKDDLLEKLIRAYQSGLQPAIHAIGDRALEMTLDAIEYVTKHCKAGSDDGNSKMLPFRIIHAQLVNNGQIERMKKLPVVLDIQPIFLCTDLYWVESRLGSVRMKDAYIWKTLMDAGLILAGGSDCPVESYDPIKGIYAAVTRQDINGFPGGGWEPDEKLSVYEAICLFTKNIAYTTGDEDVSGTIEKGKFADLAVLDSDPFEIQPNRIKNIKVLSTFVAGRQVYGSI